MKLPTPEALEYSAVLAALVVYAWEERCRWLGHHWIGRVWVTEPLVWECSRCGEPAPGEPDWIWVVFNLDRIQIAPRYTESQGG